jgi:hypothetical protein
VHASTTPRRAAAAAPPLSGTKTLFLLWRAAPKVLLRLSQKELDILDGERAQKGQQGAAPF